MIKTEKSVPEIFYRDSRDFQFLGRVFDTVFNSLKTNSELVESNPFSDNFDTKLIDLLTLTLGFKSRHHYNINQLTAMCSAFMRAIKCKGTIKSIQTAVDTLLRAEGISDAARIEVDSETSTLQIYVPLALKDTNLLNDLLDYILPAGMGYEIIKQLALAVPSNTNIVFTNKGVDGAPQIWSEKHPTSATSIIPEADVIGGGIVPSRARAGLSDNTTVVGKEIGTDSQENENEGE